MRRDEFEVTRVTCPVSQRTAKIEVGNAKSRTGRGGCLGPARAGGGAAPPEMGLEGDSDGNHLDCAKLLSLDLFSRSVEGAGPKQDVRGEKKIA